MQALALAALTLATVSCAELQNADGEPLFSNRMLVTPTSVPPTTVPARAVNLSPRDFPSNWIVKGGVSDGGSLDLTAYDPAEPESKVVTSVLKAADQESAERSLESLTSRSGIEIVDRAEVGEEAVVVTDEKGLHVYFRVGSVLAKVSALGQPDSGEARTEALAFAGRLEQRIAGTDDTSDRELTTAKVEADLSDISVDSDIAADISSIGSLQIGEIADLTSATSSTTAVLEVPDGDEPPVEDDAGPDELVVIEEPGVPDLVLDAVRANLPLARPGEKSSWSFAVRNGGNGDAEAFVVNVFAHGELEGEGTAVLALDMPGMAPGHSFGTAFELDGVTEEYLTVVVGDDDIVDGDLSNNRITVMTGDAALPDLAFELVEPSRRDAFPGNTINWNVTVSNVGPGNLQIPVGLDGLDNADGSTVITAQIPPLLRGETFDIALPVRTKPDTLLQFVVDPLNDVQELAENNNASDEVPGKIALRPDLSIDSVEPIPAHPRPGDIVEWIVTVSNVGHGPSDPSQLELIASPSSTTTEPITVPGLDSGESYVATSTYPATRDTILDFQVVSGVTEVKDDNNEKLLALNTLFLPDLVITAVDPDREDIWPGQEFTWDITIANVGAVDMTKLAAIAMVDGETGEEIDSTGIPKIAAGGEYHMSMDVLVADEEDTLVFIVDAFEVITEADELNNAFTSPVSDVLVHDLQADYLTIISEPDEDNVVSWRWQVTNTGPGRARDVEIRISVTRPDGTVEVLEPVIIDEIAANKTIQGGFKRPALERETFVIEVVASDQTDTRPYNNTLTVESTFLLI